MFLCSTRSEAATCSALCSFQSLAKLLLLQTVELNLQRVLLGQLKKKKNKKKKTSSSRFGIKAYRTNYFPNLNMW